MENVENGNGMMGPSNAMWGNMNWGNTPFWGYGPGYGYGRGGAGGVATAGLITGIIGSVLGLATGGFGLAGMGRNGWGPNGSGPNGGQNLYDQVQALSAELSSVKADVAVNTQRDVDLAEQTKLQIEIATKDAKIQTLESERRIDRRIDELNNQVITNAGVLGCVVGKVNDLTQIGIPSANIITPPAAGATTSTAGA